MSVETLIDGQTLLERLDSHMGQADVPVLLRDCRLAFAEITRLRAEVESLREAARPFAGLISAFDTDIAAFLRRDQPEAAASLSNAELAALHTPDETVLVTDGAMAFGHDEHRRQSTKVNAGHFRRLAALIPAESDHG